MRTVHVQQQQGCAQNSSNAIQGVGAIQMSRTPGQAREEIGQSNASNVSAIAPGSLRSICRWLSAVRCAAPVIAAGIFFERPSPVATHEVALMYPH